MTGPTVMDPSLGEPSRRDLELQDYDITKEIGFYQLVWRRFASRRLALIALGVLMTLVLACFLLPSYLPPLSIGEPYLPPSLIHPFGTDEVGNDLLVRTLQGGQISLEVGIAAMLVTILIATLVGALAGYFGGIIDATLSTITNAFLIIPGILVLIAFADALFRAQGKTSASVLTIIVGIALVSWPFTARIIRSVVLSLREKEYVEAARALGTPQLRIIFRHILPNTLGPIIVSASLTVVLAILTESAISFLGVGIGAPIATWGSLLSSGEQAITSNHDFYYALWPGLMILITVMCFNYLGDALRDAFDPRAIER